jgi:hypothetical protein
VKRLAHYVALVLVALWLPASSHAVLLGAGFIHSEHGASHGHHHHDGQHNLGHDLADGVCRFVSGDSQVHAPAVVVLPLSAWLEEQLSGTPCPTSVGHFGIDPLGTAPPDLPVAWQFSSRTALPGRAPSLLG